MKQDRTKLDKGKSGFAEIFSKTEQSLTKFNKGKSGFTEIFSKTEQSLTKVNLDLLRYLARHNKV